MEQCLTYDANNRLLTAKVGINDATCSGTVGNGEYADQTYSYSTSTGNLSSKTGLGAYTYDSTQPHAVDAVTGYTYLYDPNGNMTRRDPSGTDYYDFVYDNENRLSQAKKNGAILATFTYDGDGNRVKSVVGFTTTLFAGQHYETSSGVVTKYYATGGTRVAMRQGSAFYWLFSDHLGSTSKVANSSGALQSQQLYKAWGETRYTSGTLPTRYTYTGQYTYATGSANDFGLIYYGARFYDNALGRFVQPDSITPDQNIPLSWDRYAYAFNNPVKFNDPSGHCPWCLGAAIGAVVGGVIGGVTYAMTNQGAPINRGEFWTAVGAGAVSGGLIGSGIGILAAATSTAAAVTGATFMVGAGTASTITELDYMANNQNTFETVPFVGNAAISGAVGGVSSVLPLSPLGVAAKGATYIIGSEASYALNTDNWTVQGAQTAAVYGTAGAAFDVGVSSLINSTFMVDTSISRNVFPTTTAQQSTSLLTQAAQFRGGTGVANAIGGTFSGTAAAITTRSAGKR